MGRIGPFQLEAAIQSAHVASRLSGSPDARGVLLLYEALAHLTPTLGVRVAHAVALANAESASRALALLDAIDERARGDYQPYWSARAHVLERLGRREEASEAYERAIGLTEEESLRQWLLARWRAMSE